ncbi:ASCH domain-containing protein [Mobilitalea sibirica]|uniref:ASCH domain-containing protein n=1 Tax=Mobilitalea sibirica TaxID=1462919 RepID=A0A8J7KW19_9FIRM|nr:ASCH domain-containing protein [Mobilitalea sibirica]MBH1940840.1 ASCH domain-containing protein [Mobilitalea sibirica]
MKNASVEAMWKEYVSSQGETILSTDKHYTSWHFCDNEEDANALAELVLEGVKRATASLYLSYEYENEELPKVGDYCIITDWSGIARCIIEVVKIDVVPYCKVTKEFAATEGEGDKSLEYWRKVHWDYFSREMESMGKEADQDMLVVCEEFQVVYPKH